MNERIKNLAEQAGFALWEDEEWKPHGEVIDWSSRYDDELEKFAKLIVRECARFCGHDPSGVDAMFNHFGVKE